MRILDLGEFYSERGGGVRSYLDKLLAAADRANHEIVVVAPGPRDEEKRQGGGRIVRYAAPRMPYDPTYHWPIRIDRMREIVRREKPDVLQVSSPFIPAFVAATLKDVPLRTYFYHSDPIGCYIRPTALRLGGEAAAERAVAAAWVWMRAVCNSVDVTIVSGHWLEEQLRQRGCRSVQTAPFGISHADFAPSRSDAQVRRQLLGRLADNPDAKLLLIAGRLAVDKRQAMLVEAIQEVARDQPVALAVLGDGPARDAVEEKAQGLQATFLKFTHDRAHYASILASVDALVHGSVCETFGFVIAETLASGTPVVVPDEGGAPALARPGCAEVYRAHAGKQAVADAIRRVLVRPCDELEAAAIEAAAEHPSMDQHFERLFELYDQMLSRREAGYAV